MKPVFSSLLSAHTDHHLSSRVTAKPFWLQMKKMALETLTNLLNYQEAV